MNAPIAMRVAVTPVLKGSPFAMALPAMAAGNRADWADARLGQHPGYDLKLGDDDSREGRQV